MLAGISEGTSNDFADKYFRSLSALVVKRAKKSELHGQLNEFLVKFRRVVFEKTKKKEKKKITENTEEFQKKISQ